MHLIYSMQAYDWYANIDTGSPLVASSQQKQTRHLRRSTFRLAALIACGSLLAACSHEPALREPAPTALPATYPAQLTNPAAPTGVAAQMAWRNFYLDAQLQEFIAAALNHNRDLQLALLKVDEARATYNIQNAERLPAIGVGSSHTRARVPGDLNMSGRSVVSGNQQAYVGLSHWELDLWGRVKSLSDAALASYLATDAGRRAVEISIMKQVALSYLALQSLDERIVLAQRTIESRQESLRIFTRRAEVGSSSKYALAQVQTLVHQAKVIGTQLQQQRDLQAHALAQLTGKEVRTLQASSPTQSPVLNELPAGLPAQLLTSRPDIASAEQSLIAAKANVTAARAAFLPRIALTGNWGTASADLDGLFKGGSRAWQFMPSVSLPIFDGGQRQTQLDLQAVRQNMAVVQYEKTIETAMREVLDSLTNRATLMEQVTVLAEQREALKERSRLARIRYDNGASPYLDVLDAERDLLSAEQQWVQSREAILSSQVSLYAALGGGSQVRP